jgi:hypothetical protein
MHHEIDLSVPVNPMMETYIFCLLIYIFNCASSSLPELGKLDLRGKDPESSLVCPRFETDTHNSEIFRRLP